MASRRARHHGAPITLFSFQDIILCVTGILILITLFLALELVTSIEVAGQPPMKLDDLATIERDISTAEREQNHIESEVRDLEKLISQSADTPFSAQGHSIDDLRGAVDTRRSANQQLRTDLDALNRRRDNEQRQAQALREQTAELLAEARQVAASAAAAAIELEEEVAGNRLLFLPGEGGGKRPLIVECTAGRLRVGQPDAGGELIELATWDGFTAVREFERWASQRDRRKEYFVLFARPDGVATYQRARLRLEELSFDVGWDAVDHDVELFAARNPEGNR